MLFTRIFSFSFSLRAILLFPSVFENQRLFVKGLRVRMDVFFQGQ